MSKVYREYFYLHVLGGEFHTVGGNLGGGNFEKKLKPTKLHPKRNIGTKFHTTNQKMVKQRGDMSWGGIS